MTSRRLCFTVLAAASCLGCSANRMQMATEIRHPLAGNCPLGQVAVFSVLSADQSRPWHAKQSAEFRKTLQQRLEKTTGVLVVCSQELPPRYGADRDRVEMSTLLQQAYARLAGRAVDTICLVQLKDAGGELSLGLAFPPGSMLSVRGKCDYEVRLFDAASGAERFCATGHWSERTEMPMLPRLPSPAGFGEQLASVLPLDGAPEVSPQASVARRTQTP